MIKIDALIVVEGKSDINFLSTFIDSNFYLVNGSAVSQKDFDFINEYLKKGKDVIILTDPDFPGMKIRNSINEHCPNCLNAYVRKEVSIKNHKVGVAESTIEEVTNALKHTIRFSEKKDNSDLKESDLIELGLTGNIDSSLKREIIINKYHLGYSNFKSMYKKLKMLGITKTELEEILKNA